MTKQAEIDSLAAAIAELRAAEARVAEAQRRLGGPKRVDGIRAPALPFKRAEIDSLYIRTNSGRRIVFNAPDPDQIRLIDIAQGLSNLCRFGGQIRTFFSVAQHSVHVSLRMPEEFAVYGLLHDAAEAYVGDVVGPLKLQLDEYRRIEDLVFGAIMAHFGLEWTDEIQAAVKVVDLRMLATEMRDLRLDAAVDDTLIASGHPPYDWRIRALSPLESFDMFRMRAAALGISD